MRFRKALSLEKVQGENVIRLAVDI